MVGKRSIFAFLLLFAFYCILPIFYGFDDWLVIVKCFTYALFMVLLVSRVYINAPWFSIHQYDWIKSLTIICWVTGIFCSIIVANLMFDVIANRGLLRQELFDVRESTLNSYATISLNTLIVSASILSVSKPRYRSALIIPVVFDVLTQSRAFIVVVLLVLFVSGTRSKKRWLYVLGLVFGGVTIIRLYQNFPVHEVSVGRTVEYLFAEPLNTAFGNSLVDQRSYSITMLQASRPLLAPFAFVGGFVTVPSEAMEFNYLIRDTMGHYGLAFGLLGFVKFSSLLNLAISLGTTFITFQIVRKLGFPREIILISCVALMPSFFRWGPGEAVFLAARVTVLIFVVTFVVRLLSGRSRRRDLDLS